MPRKSKSRGDHYGPRGRRRAGLRMGRITINEEVFTGFHSILEVVVISPMEKIDQNLSVST